MITCRDSQFCDRQECQMIPPPMHNWVCVRKQSSRLSF